MRGNASQSWTDCRMSAAPRRGDDCTRTCLTILAMRGCNCSRCSAVLTAILRYHKVKHWHRDSSRGGLANRQPARAPTAGFRLASRRLTAVVVAPDAGEGVAGAWATLLPLELSECETRGPRRKPTASRAALALSSQALSGAGGQRATCGKTGWWPKGWNS